MPDPISALEQDLEDLRKAFEFSFAGIEKRLPLQQRDELAARIRRMPFPKDAVNNFRYQNLLQRLLSYEQYWNRTIKAIEDGTYERDIRRADRKDREAGKTSVKSTGEGNPNVQQAISQEAENFLAELTGQQPKPQTQPVTSPETPVPDINYKVAMRGQSLRHLNLPNRSSRSSLPQSTTPAEKTQPPSEKPLRPTLPSGMPIIRPTFLDQQHHAPKNTSEPLPLFSASHKSEAPSSSMPRPQPMTPASQVPASQVPASQMPASQMPASQVPGQQPSNTQSWGIQPAHGTPKPLHHPTSDFRPSRPLPVMSPEMLSKYAPASSPASNSQPAQNPAFVPPSNRRPSRPLPVMSPEELSKFTPASSSSPQPAQNPAFVPSNRRPSRPLPVMSPEELSKFAPAPAPNPQPAQKPFSQSPRTPMPLHQPTPQPRPSRPLQPLQPLQPLHSPSEPSQKPAPTPQSNPPMLPMRGSSKSHQSEP